MSSRYRTDYKHIAASQTNSLLGGTGAPGDTLMAIIAIPVTASPGQVSIKDGNGSDLVLMRSSTGGVVDNLEKRPVVIRFGDDGIRCSSTTTPGWRVTTGANVEVIAVGSFT